jgi:NADPH:quinone reductase
MIDEGTIRSTLSQGLGPINAATLRQAHSLVEAGQMVGKAVVAGW